MFVMQSVFNVVVEPLLGDKLKGEKKLLKPIEDFLCFHFLYLSFCMCVRGIHIVNQFFSTFHHSWAKHKLTGLRLVATFHKPGCIMPMVCPIVQQWDTICMSRTHETVV